MNPKTYTVFLLFLLFFLPPMSAQFSLLPEIKYRPFTLAPDARYVEGKIIFKIKSEYRHLCEEKNILLPTLQQKLGTLKSENLTRVFPTIQPPATETNSYGQKLTDLSTLYEFSYSPQWSVEDAVNFLLTEKSIAYAEPWYVYEPLYIPNDPYSDTTGFLNGIWHHEKIQALQTWDTHWGNPNIVIATVDAGFNLIHPDLQDNIFLNTDDPVDGIDNDQDGYVDNYRGWDLAGATIGSTGDNNPSIGNVHGHWVVGTYGATADNHLGSTGTAFNCSFLPVKAAADDSIGSITHGYQGIVYAVNQGAHIINASWGGSFRSQFGEDVIRYATLNHQAAVIAAAGNSGQNQRYYPAGYPEVISVANVAFGDTLCCPDNSGNSTFHHSVDISAPGWRIVSPYADDDYRSWKGTSASAPVVSGVVGMTLSAFPQLTPFQAAQRVRITADDIYAHNPQFQDYLGLGRVNMFRAINDPLKPAIRHTEVVFTDTDGDHRLAPGDTVVVSINFLNYLQETANLTVTLSSPTVFATVISGNLQPGKTGMMQGFSSGQQFRIVLSPAVPNDVEVELKLSYEDPVMGYTDFEYISHRVNESWLNIDHNHLHTTLTSQGGFGFNDYFSQQQGIGVSYNLEENALFEGGFLTGNSVSRVSDHIRNTQTRDNDFKIGEEVHRDFSDRRADFVYTTTFSDVTASLPLGVSITQKTFVYENSPYEDFIIFQYLIQNAGTLPISGLYAGLFADWDIYIHPHPLTGLPGTRNAANFDTTEKMVFAWDLSGGSSSYYALSLLSSGNFHAFATTNPSSNFQFTNSGKYQALKNVPTAATASAGITAGGSDVMQFISTGPFTLIQQQTDTATFAVIGGKTWSEVQLSNAAAREVYYCRILEKGPVAEFSVSDTWALPGTEIQFTDNNPQATSWLWDFGDGNTSTLANPQHSYSQTGEYTVMLTVSDGVCTLTTKQTVTISNQVSVDPESGGNNWRLYPNPNGGTFSLEVFDSYSGKYEIRITDLRGRICMEHEGIKGAGEMRVQLDSGPNLSRGIYFLHYHSGETIFSLPFVRE
ncbi:MAG: S8 family serine peptidase [Bacteroidia bacterium]|nr:S8 family serine peptidase [Bacteroidia bacterium]